MLNDRHEYITNILENWQVSILVHSREVSIQMQLLIGKRELSIEKEAKKREPLKITLSVWALKFHDFSSH